MSKKSVEVESVEEYSLGQKVENANTKFREKHAELQEKRETEGATPELGEQPPHVTLHEYLDDSLVGEGTEGLTVDQVKDGQNPAGLRVFNQVREYLNGKIKELEGEPDTYSPSVRSLLGFFIDRLDHQETSFRGK